MQRFLLLLLFVAMLVNTTSVRACSYERLSVEQLYAKASTVFVAHIVRTEEATGLSPLSVKPEAIVEATFRLVENLKGQPPPDGKVKSLVWSNGNCSVLLAAGLDYLFFLHDDSFVLVGGGSTPIMLEGVESVTAEPKSLLRRLRALSELQK